MNLFLRWSKKEHPLAVRLLVMVLAALVFLLLIPYTLVVLLPQLDTLLRLPSFFIGWVNMLAGVLMIGVGIFFGWWSIGMQLFDGRGTPLPILPTQKLLISGPFKYCRNPMTFGTICAYGGVAVMVGSLVPLLAVAFFGSLLVVYLIRIEERELALRFGQAYLDYKASTPFLLPRFTR